MISIGTRERTIIQREFFIRGSIHMILSIHLVVSMLWIHTHDPVYLDGCIHIMGSCIVKCLFICIIMHTYIKDVRFIVSCLIFKSPNGVSLGPCLDLKSISPINPVLPSCFRGHLLQCIFSHFLSCILKRQND